MAERVVTLKLKLDDKEVVNGEASINRLKATAGDARSPKALKEIETGAEGVDRAAAKAAQRLGISYDQMIAKMKATATASVSSSNVISAADKKRIAEAHTRGIAVEKAAKAEEEIAAASEAAAGGLAQILTKAGPVGIAIGALVIVFIAAAVAAYKLGQKVFELAKQFAEYVIEISKAAEANGLMVETWSALKMQADRTGTAVDSLNGPIDNFRKLIGQAAAGSEEARAKVASLGLDLTTAGRNIDASFRVAVSTIVNAKNPIDQIRLATAAFGEEGYKLLPFLRSFNGDIASLEREADKLGITIGGKDVKAAKEFNRAYSDLQNAIKGLTNLFGREFLPIVTKVITDFTGWLLTNKDDIKGWAEWSAEKLKMVADWWGRIADNMERYRKAQDALQKSEADFVMGKDRPKGPPPLAPSIDANKVYGTPTVVPGLPPPGQDDPLALAERLKREAERRADFNKREFAASLQSWELSASHTQSVFSRVFQKLEKEFAEVGDSEKFRSNVDKLVTWYIGKISEADAQINRIENEQARRNNATPNELKLLSSQQQIRNQGFSNLYVDKQKEVEDKIKAHTIKSAEEAMRRRIELSDQALGHILDNYANEFAAGVKTERDYIDAIGKAQLDGLEKRRSEFQKFLSDNKVEGDKRKEIEQEIGELTADIDQQRLRNSRALTREEERRRDVLTAISNLDRENADPAAVAARRRAFAKDQEFDLKLQITQMQDLIANGGINDALVIYAELLRTIVDLRNQELDATISIMNSQIRMSQSMQISGNQIKAQVYEHLAQQRTLNEAIGDGINQTYDALASKLDEQIDKMFTWAGAFKSLFTEPLKAIARNNLTNFTTKILDAIVPGLGQQYKDATINPIAKPITEKLTDTNKLLGAILGRLGGSPVTGASGGLGNILSGLGIGGSGSSVGGTPPFVASGSGGGGIFGSGGLISRLLGSRTGTISGSGDDEAYNVDGRSWWDKLTGAGGMLGPRENVLTGKTSKAAGIMGGIGDIASMVGGMIGGRWGGVISMAGQGASIGAMFGPWGAAIGAGAGFLLGLFMGDPNRKKDKKENIPALNKGFTDAFKQLNEILTGVRQMTMDPAEAITRAGEVRSEIAGGFGIQFLSKKYRKEAQKMIDAKLVQADGIIAQITEAAAIARGAADRSKRILPEFAVGHYFRPNGLLPGNFDGADNILAMISRGEMVINPRQQNRVRALAGFDVFAGAGIPNYPRASSSPKLAVGGIAGVGLASASAPNITFQPNMRIVLVGDAFDDKAAAWLESDNGKRTLVTVTRDQRSKGRI